MVATVVATIAIIVSTVPMIAPLRFTFSPNKNRTTSTMFFRLFVQLMDNRYQAFLEGGKPEKLRNLRGHNSHRKGQKGGHLKNFIHYLLIKRSPVSVRKTVTAAILPAAVAFALHNY